MGPTPWGLKFLILGFPNAMDERPLIFKILIAETATVFNRAPRVPWMDGSYYFSSFTLTILKGPTPFNTTLGYDRGPGSGASCFGFRGFAWKIDILVVENPEMSTPETPTSCHLPLQDRTTTIIS
jgi:hypothetical protein